MSKFKIGDKVAPIYGGSVKLGSKYQFDTISGILPNDKYNVSSKHSTYQRAGRDLMLEEDVILKQAELEVAFDNVRVQLEAKVAEASKALRELGNLAEAAGFSLGNDEGGVAGGMYKLVAPIMNAIDECGWSSSSMGC